MTPSQSNASPPSFEGRTLPRPDDEVVDQGLAFDIGTLFTRRRAFQVAGIASVGAMLASCTSASTASTSSSASASATSTTGLTEIPDETAGPYPGDGSNGPDILEQSGVVRSDIRSSFGTSTTTAEGIAMTLTLTILDIVNGGNPMKGAAVYVWHCNRSGEYSMYSQGITNENYLRGVQVTDDSGQVSFTSIFPACYSGRWPHIHFEVYPDEASITDSTKAIATSQVALPKSVCDTVYATTGYEASVTNLAQLTLATDNVFGNDTGVHQLATVTGDVTKGYAVALTAPVDTSTTPSGGDAPAGRGAPPSGAPSASPSQ